MATIRTLKMQNNDVIYPFIWITDADALSQRISNRIKAYLGEWYLNTSEGINWFELLGKNYDSDNAKKVLSNEILKDELAISVIDIDIEYISTQKKSESSRVPNRTMVITLSLNTRFGIIRLEESL